MWYFWLLESLSDRESDPDGELTEKDDEREYVAGDAYSKKIFVNLFVRAA